MNNENCDNGNRYYKDRQELMLIKLTLIRLKIMQKHLVCKNHKTSIICCNKYFKFWAKHVHLHLLTENYISLLGDCNC